MLLRTTLAASITSARVQQALSHIPKYAQAALNSSGVPGVSIALVHNDQVVYTKGFGVRAINTNDQVTADTVFQLASMSKPIAASIVAALVGDGYLNWDDSANSLDSNIVLSDPWITQEVTVKDFFCHRSGLYGDAGNDIDTFDYDQETIIQRLRYLAPGGPFRSSYAYSNHGISSGAIAAAKAAGQSWPDVAKQKIYSPLGMSSTSSTYADFLTRSNRASLHVPSNGTANGTWILGPKRNADAQAPAAGVSSSANDLAQWLRMELANGTYNSKPVVQAEALLEARTPQVVRGTNPATGYPGFYGLGWNWDIDSAGYIVLSHAGAFSQGARTYVHMLPEENIGMIVLSNAFPTGLPEGIAYTFFDYLHYNRSTEDWLQIWDNAYNALTAGYTQAEAPYVQAPSMPAPALNLSAYEGTYNNDYVGNVSCAGQRVLSSLRRRSEWQRDHDPIDTLGSRSLPELSDTRAADHPELGDVLDRFGWEGFAGVS